MPSNIASTVGPASQLLPKAELAELECWWCVVPDRRVSGARQWVWASIVVAIL